MKKIISESAIFLKLFLATAGGFTPDQVQNHLQQTAENLAGLSTNQEGASLVDVEKAVLTP